MRAYSEAELGEKKVGGFLDYRELTGVFAGNARLVQPWLDSSGN
jgi:hypothetical protein